ncbi:MAG TPA: hypothetical protein V6C97_07310 [Oculatellaceae cyanobacterium]
MEDNKQEESDNSVSLPQTSRQRNETLDFKDDELKVKANHQRSVSGCIKYRGQFEHLVEWENDSHWTWEHKENFDNTELTGEFDADEDKKSAQQQILRRKPAPARKSKSHPAASAAHPVRRSRRWSRLFHSPPSRRSLCGVNKMDTQ